MFTCLRCGANGAITLPAGGGPDVVCSACGVRQARREYEIQRLQGDFQRAMERARAAPPAPVHLEPLHCPACGDDLFTSEHGCPKCGHGRASRAQRNPALIAALTFVVALGIGLGLLFGVGAVATGAGGVMLNLAPLLTGAFLVAYGVRAFQRPSTITLGDVHTDAFGHSHFSNQRQATSEQGIAIGAICLVLGILALALGVCVGYLGA